VIIDTRDKHESETEAATKLLSGETLKESDKLAAAAL